MKLIYRRNNAIYVNILCSFTPKKLKTHLRNQQFDSRIIETKTNSSIKAIRRITKSYFIDTKVSNFTAKNLRFRQRQDYFAENRFRSHCVDEMKQFQFTNYF